MRMCDLKKELMQHVGDADWVGRYMEEGGFGVLSRECRRGGGDRVGGARLKHVSRFARKNSTVLYCTVVPLNIITFFISALKIDPISQPNCVSVRPKILNVNLCDYFPWIFHELIELHAKGFSYSCPKIPTLMVQ